jgi:uncharacterized lipoprotein YajG
MTGYSMMISRRLAWGAAMIVAVILLNGCITSGGAVTLAYVPEANAFKVNGADNVKVRVAVVDKRAITDRISAIRNLSNMETAPITTTNRLDEFVRDALETELIDRGYTVTPGGAVVEVEIQQLYADYNVGFLRKLNTNARYLVRVLDSNGKVQFTKTMTDEFNKPGAFVSTKRAKDAIEIAVKSFSSDLFRDSTFLQALADAK